MKRQFSRRETILLLILALIVVGCLYYVLVDQPVRSTLSDAQLRYDSAQSEIEVETVMLDELNMMRAALAELNSSDAEVPDYNNSENVLRLLNEAMSYTDTYNMTFQPLAQEGQVIDRTISMSFVCSGYDSARRAMSTLYNSPYRCEINRFEMAAAEGGAGTALTDGGVKVTLDITFYEFFASAY